ncbi:MAG TPA: hypothetical protein P5572_00380 [Phycisphaerae bacterium]|nr:hypothetical protein [Phycisphaerales bacterium]HRX83454.1 hypothetical protein [Phycisphaerae bacterium]
MRKFNGWAVLAVAAVVLGAVTMRAQAQIEQDWAVFTDEPTGTACDIVNGSNVEFVVLFDSGNLATVSGVVLTDLVVDITDPLLPVTFDGAPAGFLDFREDGDGLPALFWLSLGETVVGIDTFSSEPFDSNKEPVEIFNTGCDACQVIDSSLCDNGNGGGFPPIFLCGAGANGSVVAAALMFPVIGRLRRRR